MFIRSGGSITCIVTGSRHYSVDLPQGGLEVPCRLQFKGNEKAINTTKPLLQNAPPEASSQVIHEATNQDSEQAKTGDAHKFTTGATAFRQNLKSVTSEPITLPDLVNESSSSEDNVWVQVRKSKLSLSDKESLLTLERPLIDKHINFAQVLFKEQYPNVSGFMSTLLQYKPLTAKLTSGVQIIHCRDFHWVTAYKKNSSKDVTVYDSMFDSPDDTLTKVITNIFDTSKLIMAPMQRQSPGSNNCGIFAIAVCMAILLEEDPSEIRFNEDVMRCHLCKCFDKKIMMKFP